MTNFASFDATFVKSPPGKLGDVWAETRRSLEGMNSGVVAVIHDMEGGVRVCVGWRNRDGVVAMGASQDSTEQLAFEGAMASLTAAHARGGGARHLRDEGVPKSLKDCTLVQRKSVRGVASSALAVVGIMLGSISLALGAVAVWLAQGLEAKVDGVQRLAPDSEKRLRLVEETLDRLQAGVAGLSSALTGATTALPEAKATIDGTNRALGDLSTAVGLMTKSLSGVADLSGKFGDLSRAVGLLEKALSKSDATSSDAPDKAAERKPGAAKEAWK